MAHIQAMLIFCYIENALHGDTGVLHHMEFAFRAKYLVLLYSSRKHFNVLSCALVRVGVMNRQQSGAVVTNAQTYWLSLLIIYKHTHTQTHTCSIF